MKRKYYDTNVLLDNPNLIRDSENRSEIYICDTVLKELDSLKTKNFKAREVIRQLLLYSKEINIEVDLKSDGSNNDDKIIQSVIDGVLITNDNLMVIKAAKAGVEVENYLNKTNDVGIYINPKVVNLEGDEFNDLYAGVCEKARVAIEEKHVPYVVVLDEEGSVCGAFKKDKQGQCKLFDAFNMQEQVIKVKNGNNIVPKDVYQKMAIDSLNNDKMTIITGLAGTGKTFLSVSYMMSMLEAGRAKKIVIFFNPVKVRDTVDLGSYKGAKEDKIIQQSIGAILANKMGGIGKVEEMIESGKLVIHPFSDIRGIEVGPEDILYLPEMQNSSIDLAKLAIQRASHTTKIIAEGDIDTQVDMSQFEGSNNGLRRYVEILSGRKGISHIHLPINYRGEISSWAEDM